MKYIFFCILMHLHRFIIVRLLRFCIHDLYVLFSWKKVTIFCTRTKAAFKLRQRNSHQYQIIFSHHNDIYYINLVRYWWMGHSFNTNLESNPSISFSYFKQPLVTTAVECIQIVVISVRWVFVSKMQNSFLKNCQHIEANHCFLPHKKCSLLFKFTRISVASSICIQMSSKYTSIFFFFKSQSSYSRKHIFPMNKI